MDLYFRDNTEKHQQHYLKKFKTNCS